MWEAKQLSPEEFSRFQEFIYRRTGIRVQDGKITLLSNRIRRRLRERGIDSFEDYFRLLSTGRLPDELPAFIDAVTTNETHFFRTDGHFTWFGGPFLEGLAAAAAAGHRPRSVRVWSAACSTGEEAYTLAICLAEARSRLVGWRLSVLGTDISETALAVARQAVYRQRSLEQVEPGRLERHFIAAADGTSWTVRPDVARLCSFRRHNLLEPLDDGVFDCVFIRNVLIYFDRESKAVAVRHLIDALAPGGYLVVGPADGIYDMLDPLEKRSTFLYQKPSP